MVNLSVILLRYVRPAEERPFSVPLTLGQFPILPLFGFVITVYMAMQFELEIILVGIGIIVAGCIFYLLYNKRKENAK